MMRSRTHRSVQVRSVVSPADGQFDHDTDVNNGDPRRIVRARPWWATAEDPGAEHRSAQQRGDDRRRSIGRNLLADRDIGEFEIIHYRDGHARARRVLADQAGVDGRRSIEFPDHLVGSSLSGSGDDQ